jgi:hypothetical protein
MLEPCNPLIISILGIFFFFRTAPLSCLHRRLARAHRAQAALVLGEPPAQPPRAPALDRPHLGRERAHERGVVRDDEHAARKGVEAARERVDSVDVEVVGGLRWRRRVGWVVAVGVGGGWGWGVEERWFY